VFGTLRLALIRIQRIRDFSRRELVFTLRKRIARYVWRLVTDWHGRLESKSHAPRMHQLLSLGIVDMVLPEEGLISEIKLRRRASDDVERRTQPKCAHNTRTSRSRKHPKSS
jgi:hypothetical protein